MRRVSRGLSTSLGAVAAVGVLGWLGLQIPPAAFPPVAPGPAVLETAGLPGGLPLPVERFFRSLYGERVPLIRSAVISGRGWLRLGGVKFPTRFRFTHDAGRAYRHYFEATVFGLPVMKVNEYYVDGRTRMELPFGVMAGDPKLDQGGNLALWAEAADWLPPILVTDPRVRWEPIDDQTALLVVPFGPGEERLVARFDPGTGRLRLLESMRYRGSETAKTLWLCEARAWGEFGGQPLVTEATVTWLDEGSPWARFTVEDAAYNVPVDVSLAVRGP